MKLSGEHQVRRPMFRKMAVTFFHSPGSQHQIFRFMYLMRNTCRVHGPEKCIVVKDKEVLRRGGDRRMQMIWEKILIIIIRHGSMVTKIPKTKWDKSTQDMS